MSKRDYAKAIELLNQGEYNELAEALLFLRAAVKHQETDKGKKVTIIEKEKGSFRKGA